MLPLWPVWGGRQEGKEPALVPHACFAPCPRCQAHEPSGAGGTQMPCPTMGSICERPGTWLFSSCSGSPQHFQPQPWWAAFVDRLLPGLWAAKPPQNRGSSPRAWAGGPAGRPLLTLSVAPAGSSSQPPSQSFETANQASCLVPELPQLQGPPSCTLSSPGPVFPQLHVLCPPAQPGGCLSGLGADSQAPWGAQWGPRGQWRPFVAC